MIKFKGADSLHRIVVLNPKGGSGKTTLAFNIAGYLASTGRSVALVDTDRQSSSMRWLQNRANDRPPVAGISVAHIDETESEVLIPPAIDYAVVDAPAGLNGEDLADYTCGAHAVLIPVLPSDLDIHAATRLVSDLLLVAQVSRRQGRVGIIANRVNERTRAFQQLQAFLDRLSISVVGRLRDTQNYTFAASEGLSIHEMAPSRAGKDLAQWTDITAWLETRLARPITARDLRRPDLRKGTPASHRKRSRVWLPAAAAVLSFAATLAWLTLGGDPGREAVDPETAMAIAGENLPGLASVPTPSSPEPAGELGDRWMLNGIAQVGGNSVMLVSDRLDRTTRSLREDDELDGWAVIDTGADYAVFAREGRHVRLMLNEDTRD